MEDDTRDAMADMDARGKVATIGGLAIGGHEIHDYESVGGPNGGDETTEGRLAPGERCTEEKWAREAISPWRVYMRLYADSRSMSNETTDACERETIEEPAYSTTECCPLGGFQRLQHGATTRIASGCENTRIWTSMRSRRPANVSRRRERREGTWTASGSGRWPGVWPCGARRDSLSKLETRVEKAGREKRGNRDDFLCDSSNDDGDEFTARDRKREFTTDRSKGWLGHVRAPVSCPRPKQELSVDRASGGRPGLVNGDYVIVELASEGTSKRAYANVVLRGLEGMHLLELSTLRERRNTWKFCFYQAIVALLAKTQLRYRYAWSANIDYVYELAWTLYTHVGAINVKEKQRLDDIVVYNYKYGVEIELIREMRNVPVPRDTDLGYEESCLEGQITLERKDPLRVRVEVGCRKMTDPAGYVPVHEETRKIEEWFDRLETRHRDCIFRTSRFSLAFWREGLFWYVYNPYRCDEFGLWDSSGSACVVKFCSKDSLRRHLMILLLRAHGYRVPRSQDPDGSRISEGDVSDVFDVEIFHVTLGCCNQVGAPKSPRRHLDLDEGAFGPLGDPLADELDGDAGREREDYAADPARERLAWLRRGRVTWSRCAGAVDRGKRDSAEPSVSDGKPRWHGYYVEEPDRLFSLWREIRATAAGGTTLDETNRGMRTCACYVVCAGMSRIIAPEYWNSNTLDVIVVCGDRYYARSSSELEASAAKSSGLASGVGWWNARLSDRFNIGETLFEARVLPAIRGRLYGRLSECLWSVLERVFSEHRFAILTCESVCLGLFKFCGTYYMCDVNSFGPPVFRYGHGTAYLLRATSFRKFVTVLVLTIDSHEPSRFALNPVEILRICEMDTSFDSRARMTDGGDDGLSRFAGKVRALRKRKTTKK